MRIFILNYCIFIGILLFIGSAWLLTYLMQEGEILVAAAIVFIGLPALSAFMIALDWIRNQITNQKDSKIRKVQQEVRDNAVPPSS